MKSHHRDFAHLRVVQPTPEPRSNRGTAMVFGPFPPLTSPSSDHASSVLHLLKSTGYRLISATGPGLALAGHQLNFTSAGRFRTSSKFLTDNGNIDLAVFYGRSAEFNRIAKPSWHRRRLEELRRIKFLARVIDSADETCLVLEEHPLTRRDGFCFWAVGHIWSRMRRKPFRMVRKVKAANDLVQDFSGQSLPMPQKYNAEASAYEAAFDTLGPGSTVRLTCTRSQQCTQSWAAKADPGKAAAITADLDQIVEVFRRHDLRCLPQFRLLSQAGSSDPRQSTQKASPAMHYACAPDPKFAKLDLPISRYMTHLRTVMGKQKEYRLSNRAEGRKFLNWALWDASAKTPARRMPMTEDLRQHVISSSKQFGPLDLPLPSKVTPTLGRDENPFPLSTDLAVIWLNGGDISLRYNIADPLDRIGFALEVLLRLPADADPHKVLGSAACTWFASRIGGNGMCLTRIEYLMALLARFELEGAAAAVRPWEEDSIRAWVQQSVYDVFPAIRRISPPAPRRLGTRHHLRVTGLPNSQTGVGSNLRMSFNAFRKLGLAPDIHDIADHLRTVELAKPPVFTRSLKRSVNLHHLNADMVPQALVSPPFSGMADAYNIGFLLWEFGVLPDTHRLALDMLDEIWVPSQFLRETYAAATDKPVHTVLKGIDIPRVPAPDLGTFGIKGRAFTFLTCFDFHSSVARKNPMAAVRAFQDAFPKGGRDDVRLIIKTTPVQERHWGDPERQMAQIQAAVASDPRLTLIAEHLPFNRLLGLIAASDCLLSPHRAEGFGLMPAYALAYKRPVIVTDYSGTTDFCTAQTSTPVPCKLVDVAANHVLHPMKGARWAEIDHDAFVHAMQDIFENPMPAFKRALDGAKHIKTCYSIDRQAERYAKRLAEIGALN